jgi:dTDP-4-dehydrorhamnose reductase
MKKIAVTGLSGAIGQVLAREWANQDQFFDLYHDRKYEGNELKVKHIKFDLLNLDRARKVLNKVNPDVVIHMAAITHIDRCESDRKNDRNGKVWKTNVEGTDMIAKYCAEKNVHMIFLSTECVFDGKKKFFSESSRVHPVNWYGVTKSEAEKAILFSKARGAIIRAVVAYHKNDSGKTIYGKILKDLKTKDRVEIVSDQSFTPTHTDDIIRAIKIIMEQELKGIYHVAPVKSLSPYKLAYLIAKTNNIPVNILKKVKLSSYYDPERARLRLSNASLRGEKTNRILKFVPKSPEEVL